MLAVVCIIAIPFGIPLLCGLLMSLNRVDLQYPDSIASTTFAIFVADYKAALNWGPRHPSKQCIHCYITRGVSYRPLVRFLNCCF